MRSIRQFLLINLLVSTVLITSFMSIGNFYLTKKNLHHYFSAQLKHTAYLVSDLQKLITIDNLFVILLSYCLLSLIILITVNYAFKSLKNIKKELVERQATDLHPISLKKIPIEIQPLIDELNKLFMRLKDSFDRNRQFSSDAAHELKTPLAALKTQIQVALLAKQEKERTAIFKEIISAINRCTHVVQQLLTLSRLSQQAIQEGMQSINLSKLTSDILAQMVPFALKKNINIELKKPEKEVMINGHEITLNILLRNLIDNAIRYTPEDRQVKVQLTKTKKQTILRIIDTGPGIPKNLRKRVFERFYRALGTETSGSGLGLAIIKQIIDLHQATIELKTPKSKKGLEVEIVFGGYVTNAP